MRATSATSLLNIDNDIDDVDADGDGDGGVGEAGTDSKGGRLRRIFESKLRTRDSFVTRVSSIFPRFGTTFPPNRFVNEDLLRANFMATVDSESPKPSGSDEPDSAEKTHLTPDTDLFFDFDFGPSDSEEDNDPFIPSDFFTQSSSPDASSTAYGSSTSGIFSDEETPSPSFDDANETFFPEFSFSPENWIGTHQPTSDIPDDESSATPTISPQTWPSPICPEPHFPFNQPTRSADHFEAATDPAKDTEDESESDLKVLLGGQERLVANSKLQSLLAQLSKGNRRMAPRIKTQAVSSSPADFSALKDSDPDLCKSSAPRLIMTQSTPDMTEYDKLRCCSINVMQQQQDERSGCGGENLSLDPEEVEDQKRVAFRRCSSLRSGKTPPMTPGRRKIVRFVSTSTTINLIFHF